MKYAKNIDEYTLNLKQIYFVTNSPHLQNQHHTWENSSTHECIAICGKATIIVKIVPYNNT